MNDPIMSIFFDAHGFFSTRFWTVWQATHPLGLIPFYGAYGRIVDSQHRLLFLSLASNTLIISLA